MYFLRHSVEENLKVHICAPRSESSAVGGVRRRRAYFSSGQIIVTRSYGRTDASETQPVRVDLVGALCVCVCALISKLSSNTFWMFKTVIDISLSCIYPSSRWLCLYSAICWERVQSRTNVGRSGGM
jgi:hypothetical protein